MKKYADLNLGDQAEISKAVTDETVRAYADLVGDDNPVHLDEAFAAKTLFRKRIAHGLLVGGLVSAVLGARLPGPGAIYLSQEFEFKQPVFIGDLLRARVEVAEKEDRQKKVKLRTWVENQKGQIVLDGHAWVLVR